MMNSYDTMIKSMRLGYYMGCCDEILVWDVGPQV